MRLPRAPLWLLGAVLSAVVPGGCYGSLSHSLSYFYLKLPEPSQELPQFFIKSYLDEQPIACYDCLTWKMEPLVPWMEEEEEETFLAPEMVFRADLEKVSRLNLPSEGLHTWQAVLACELWEDGTKGGFLHYSYDGMDFISFDKETLRWRTAQHLAEKVKKKWEEEAGWSENMKIYLEETCIEWLQRYLSYKKEALQRTEPPVGQVNYKVVNDSLEVLICQAFGFYPKEIQAIWTRDGEICQYETLHRNVAPNSDGTYYVQLRIEINPKERDRFRCHLEHKGLREPLVLPLKEKTATKGWWIPLGSASISGVGILFLIYLCKKCRKNLNEGVTTCHLPEINHSRSMDGREDEIQSQRLLQPKTTSEHKASNRCQRPRSDPELMVVSFRKQKESCLQDLNHGLGETSAGQDQL